MRTQKFLVFGLSSALTFGFLMLWRMQAQDKSTPSTTMTSIDP